MLRLVRYDGGALFIRMIRPLYLLRLSNENKCIPERSGGGALDCFSKVRSLFLLAVLAEILNRHDVCLKQHIIIT